VKKIEICVSAPTAALDGLVWYSMVWYAMAWHGLVWHGSSTAGHPGSLAAWRLAAFQSPDVPVGVSGCGVCLCGRASFALQC